MTVFLIVMGLIIVALFWAGRQENKKKSGRLSKWE